MFTVITLAYTMLYVIIVDLWIRVRMFTVINLAYIMLYVIIVN